jgi:hypothetical protein
MSIFRRRRDTTSPSSRRVDAFVVGEAPDDAPPEDSDVFARRREKLEPVDLAAVETVTLFVFGWHNVEPGPLSWVFPSLRAALAAVRTMRNAAQWCIARGTGHTSIESARADGAVLIEQV